MKKHMDCIGMDQRAEIESEEEEGYTWQQLKVEWENELEGKWGQRGRQRIKQKEKEEKAGAGGEEGARKGMNEVRCSGGANPLPSIFIMSHFPPIFTMICINSLIVGASHMRGN